MMFSTLFASLVLAQTPLVIHGDEKEPVIVSGRGAESSRIVLYGVQGGRTFVSRTATQNERRVSLKVKDASLNDVLGKLPKVDYVVDADTFKNRRITLSLSDVPLSRALDAIASAMDAHWEDQNGIRILKPGAGFGYNGTAFRNFTLPKDGAFFQNITPDQKLRIEGLRKDLFKDGKPIAPMSPEGQKKLEELRLKLKDRSVYFNSNDRKTDVDGLLKSISPAQKELMKSQGHLKLSDLTANQRKMIDFKGDGQFEMTITRNGETLRIKN